MVGERSVIVAEGDLSELLRYTFQSSFFGLLGLPYGFQGLGKGSGVEPLEKIADSSPLHGLYSWSLEVT